MKKYDGKLTGRHVGSGYSRRKTSGRKRKVATQLKPSVDKRFRGIEEEDIKKNSTLFAGKEICVMSGDDKMSKSQLERMVVENGGTIVQNPGNETFCVLAGKVTLKVNNIIKVGIRDVVKFDWLVRCNQQQQLLSWMPADMIHSSPKTKTFLECNYDCHGDSFYEDSTEETLRMIFDNMNLEDLLSVDQINEMVSKDFKEYEKEFGIFRAYRAHFYPSRLDSFSKILFEFYGGRILENPPNDEDGDTVIIKLANPLQGNLSMEGESEVVFPTQLEVVSEQWVLKSVEAKMVLSREPYLVS